MKILENERNYLILEDTNEARILYYSYETLIAFRVKGKLYITKNKWGTTTGKHLNRICTDKSIRMDYEAFRNKAREFKII